MNNEELIEALTNLKYSLVLNQEYEMAGKVREIINFLELEKYKE